MRFKKFTIIAFLFITALVIDTLLFMLKKIRRITFFPGA